MASSPPPNSLSTASARVTKKKLVTNPVPLSLDTALRLHPQQLNLGKTELLTDALRLPFIDIESRLGHYALSGSGEEMKRLAKHMKNYLGRLNANPHIPLKFRLNVLNRFEQELDLFDAEMTAAVLNAHKIGVMLVQEAARNDASYYTTLVDMIANAIELAIKLLLMNMQQYRAPSVIVTRQFFDLARLGLDVSATLGDSTASTLARLHKAISNHEMLRKIDFFGHTLARQQQIWQEMQCHIGALAPIILHRGEQATNTDGNHNIEHNIEHNTGHNTGSFMIINLNRPNDAGRIIQQLPSTAKYDYIVIDLNTLTARLNKAIHSAEAVLLDQYMQKKALHTEQALESTLTGGKAMLAALRDEKRSSPRTDHAEARIQIHFNLPKAVIKAFTAPESVLSKPKPTEIDQADTWNVINFSQHGVCLERMHGQSPPELPDHLVGLKWIFAEHGTAISFSPCKEGMDKNVPQAPCLGFICWSKILKAGELRIGIKFFGPNFKLAKAMMSGGSQNIDDKRSWPVLVRPGNKANATSRPASHVIIFPETHIYKHMTFTLLQGNQQAHFKIEAITHAGLNYTQCNMIRAKTSGPATS